MAGEGHGSGPVTVYGLSACDRCRKAARALREAGHEVTFRDIRSNPLDDAELAAIVAAFGEAAVNRRSPSFRHLDPPLKAAAPGAQIRARPEVMKRPVIRAGGHWSLGWDAEAAARLAPRPG